MLLRYTEFSAQLSLFEHTKESRMSMAQDTAKLFQKVLDHSHIAHPYPLYEQFREAPIGLEEDGTYVVSTDGDVVSVVQDPRVSSDERKSADQRFVRAGPSPAFLVLDPPEHDMKRRLVMSQFTPERIAGTRPHIEQVVRERLDAQKQSGQMDIVDDFAYPLPVTVICRLLGVPLEDEERFQRWSTILASQLDPGQIVSEEQRQKIDESSKQMREYQRGLIANLREHPADNLLSGIITANETAHVMSADDILATASLLLIAGHETTVNLITNGTLTLIRQPTTLERLRQEPELIITFVEEMLRYDPPVQFRTRTTLADIEISGTTIPKGASLVLLLASGSHDPAPVEHPEQCIPARKDNQNRDIGCPCVRGCIVRDVPSARDDD